MTERTNIISIITINLDNSVGLEKTIQSTLAQKNKDFEFIIVDGGSTDGSVDVIKKYENHIDYWVSEKDNGIYHAMNKGILKSKGKYLLFLNSEDYFFNDNSLANISVDQNDDIIYGNYTSYYPVSNHYEEIDPGNILDLKYFAHHALSHQAVFFKRELFEKYGLYDESYKICSDWVYLVNRIVINKCSYLHLNKTITVRVRGGISDNPNHEDLKSAEVLRFFKSISPEYLAEIIENYFYLFEKLNELNIQITQLANKPVIKTLVKINKAIRHFKSSIIHFFKRF